MSWLIGNATKDKQTLTAQWTPAAMRLIDGVSVREVLNVPKQNGYLTEIFRREWFTDAEPVDQVFQVVLDPGAISAWHAHGQTLDRLFISHGLARVVLYDAREGSPTHGLVNEFRFGTVRPALINIPRHVWHGVQNAGSSACVILNLVDRAYDYEDPDHWRLPIGAAEIPFAF